jgi:hypothetical protein
LLELLQCRILLHFEDVVTDAESAGESLRLMHAGGWSEGFVYTPSSAIFLLVLRVWPIANKKSLRVVGLVLGVVAPAFVLRSVPRRS